MTDLLNPETAIRSYLVALEDPTKLVDPDQIASLEAAATRATDPIDKLKALAKLERARNINLSSYEQGFIRHAKKWASENNIPVTTFKSFGVEDHTLKAAGLLRTSKMTNGSAARRGTNGSRSTSVTTEQIKAHVAGRKGTFTLADVADAVGGSPMTLRKAIGELVKDGSLSRLGTDPTHAGRGRAPILYERR